jgi:hypothetical protein
MIRISGAASDQPEADVTRPTSDSPMPSTNAPTSASTTESKRPISAAHSAGTTSSVRSVGDIPAIGASRMIARPLMAPPMAQFAAAMKSGDQPIPAATASFSQTALVARPKRVRRCSTTSPTVSNTDSATSHSCSELTLS